MLVGMLPARAGRTEPPIAEVILVPTIEIVGTLRAREHTDGDGRGVDSPALLCRWYSLDSMAARFFFEALDVRCGRNRHLGRCADDLVLSALS